VWRTFGFTNGQCCHPSERHNKLMRSRMCSINRAAEGHDERIDPNQDIRAYNREDDRFYPYKTHGQYLRAIYGLCGSGLLVLFSGWSSLVPPKDTGNFLAAYINVSRPPEAMLAARYAQISINSETADTHLHLDLHRVPYPFAGLEPPGVDLARSQRRPPQPSLRRTD
jgi:hypothetical protein